MPTPHPRGLRRLLEACGEQLIIYFALAPQITIAACQALTRLALPEGTRLVLEKPFGTNAASAAALNDLLGRLVPEDQIYRVDHFLGMSTVLNLVGLRFANRILEPVLNAQHVASIDIVFDESLALFGMPLSEPVMETNPTDGKQYLTQHFERARFEFHPENAGTQYEVLLGLLGRELTGTK